MPGRLASRWLRIALAMVFGFMTLGHGPIMTFAHAGQRDAAPAHHGHQGHHHGTHHEDHGSAAATDEPAVCNAFGCFITVPALVIAERQPVLLPIGKLQPAPPPAATANTPEPADPPPRLHA